jgi:hypothetical protein
MVREVYDETQALTALTLMYRPEPGLSPDTNDWRWAKLDIEGNVQITGRPAIQQCSGCHLEVQANNDWLLSYQPPSPTAAIAEGTDPGAIGHWSPP